MRTRTISLFLMLAFSLTGFVFGQRVPEVQVIPNWPAPPYWVSPEAPSGPSLLALRSASDQERGLRQGPTNNGGFRGLSVTPEAGLVAAPVPLPFVAITPCRVADTRGNGFVGQYGPPSIFANTQRSFTITGQCGIPANAAAVSFNFGALNIGGTGDLRVFPAGAGTPLVSTLNYNANTPNIANAAVVPLGTGGAITVQPDNISIDLIIDVNGYYADIDSPRAWALVADIGPVFVRAKNFIALARPSTGLYCLTPAAGINLVGSVAVVTVEWGNSLGNDLLAFVNDGTHNCPAGQLEVRTYQNFSSLTLSNTVSFNVVLP